MANVNFPFVGGDDQSFEVSNWFVGINLRLKRLQNQRMRYFYWRSFSRQLTHLANVQYFKTVKADLTEKRSKLNIHKSSFSNAPSRKMRFLREDETEFHQTFKPRRVRRHDALPKRILPPIPPPDNRDKWISFMNRFKKQTLFFQLKLAVRQRKRDKIHTHNELQEQWKDLCRQMISNNLIRKLKKSSKHLIEMKSHWLRLISHVLLHSRMIEMETVHTDWRSLRMKTDVEIAALWKRGSRFLLRKFRILKDLRETRALQTLTNFIKYVMLISRSRIVAFEFEPHLKSTAREITQNVVLESVERIRAAARESVRCGCRRFAEHFSCSIVDAFSCLAQSRLGTEEYQRATITFPSVYKPFPKPLPEPEIHYQTLEGLSDIEDDIESITYGTKIIRIERDYSQDILLPEIVHDPIEIVIENVHSRSDSEEVFEIPEQRRPLQMSRPRLEERFGKSHIFEDFGPRVIPERKKRTSKVHKQSKVISDSNEITELNWRFDNDPSSSSGFIENHENQSLVRIPKSDNVLVEEEEEEEIAEVRSEFEESSHIPTHPISNMKEEEEVHESTSEVVNPVGTTEVRVDLIDSDRHELGTNSNEILGSEGNDGKRVNITVSSAPRDSNAIVEEEEEEEEEVKNRPDESSHPQTHPISNMKEEEEGHEKGPEVVKSVIPTEVRVDLVRPDSHELRTDSNEMLESEGNDGKRMNVTVSSAPPDSNAIVEEEEEDKYEEEDSAPEFDFLKNDAVDEHKNQEEDDLPDIFDFD
jgi:hypothetical protein